MGSPFFFLVLLFEDFGGYGCGEEFVRVPGFSVWMMISMRVARAFLEKGLVFACLFLLTS